jgi:guanylate kinase
MPDSPPIIVRTQALRAKKLQNGTIISYTVIAHPPAGFSARPRCIALVELEDGSHTLGQLIVPAACTPCIGQKVRPRITLNRTTDQGLKMYDVAYELVLQKPQGKKEGEFPGYILALTGPSGVGKSTVSALLATVFSDRLARVPIMTTRKPKKGDEGEYQYLSTRDFLALEKKGDIIAATLIPSTSETRWYGYRAKDIEAIWSAKKIPIVVTEMGLLQGMAKHYGRRSILSFGLLPPGNSKRAMLSQLLHRLRSRGRDSEEHIQDRIKNAEKDLKFFEERQELFDHLVVNEDLGTVVDALKGHVMEATHK